MKSTLLTMADRIEAAGYHSVCVADSVVAKPRFEALTLMAAIAARTERVKIGVGVLLAALRHPIHLARQAATIDRIADGRLILAFGAGGGYDELIPEWDALGVPYRERGPRMDETIDICRKLWSRDNVIHEGRFFQFQDVTILPKPFNPSGIPIWTVCGQGGNRIEAQYRRVIQRTDGWTTVLTFPEQCRQVIKALEAEARDAGRDPETIHSSITLRVNINPNREQAREEFEEHLYRYFKAKTFWKEEGGHHLWGPYGSAEYIRERIQTYADAGIKTIIVLFTAHDQLQQLEAFTEQVWPYFA